MIKHFIIFLVVVGSAVSQPLRLKVTHVRPIGRRNLSHAKTLIEYYRNLQAQSLRHHDLSNTQSLQNYEQAALETDHVSFTLDLTIAGLPYKLSMDTGSSDFFIKGENSPGMPIMKYKSNSNYNILPVIQIGYLDGNLRTYATNLNVQFNDHTFNAPMLVAYTAPPQFQDVEGLIGLSYPQLAQHQPTFIQTLIKQNIISKYAFGMNLNLLQDNRSFISFGEADPQLYEGELNEYSIGMTQEISVSFGYLRVGASHQMKINWALLDTGNTCISIPRRYEQIILAQFNTMSNKCVFAVEEEVPMFFLLICKIRNFNQLPVIKMAIENDEYTIEKEFYLRFCTQNPQQIQPSAYYCETYIETVASPLGDMIFLGDAFFFRFYTYFDLEAQKVGIAKNRENITLTEILTTQTFEYDPFDWVKLN